MAQHYTPHFHNQPGVAQIRIGAKEFMCIGALPPFDHPHVYLDMGAGSRFAFDSAENPRSTPGSSEP